VSITQAGLPGSTVTVIGLAALGVVALDVTWQVVRHLAVMAHHGAHAVTGLLLRRSFGGIELYADGGGLTDLGSAAGLLRIPIVLSGYLGPSVFGLGAAKLIELRYSTVVLWVLLVLLGVLLAGLRRSFGLISVILTAVTILGIALFTPAHVQVVSSYSITWLLLLSGVRRVLDAGLRSADGIRLRGATGLPHVLWSLLWLAGTLAAAAEGARLLLT
jgi:Peptidase M50B-like